MVRPVVLAAALLAGLALAAPAGAAVGLDPGRLHTHDVDGDGLADVVVPDAAAAPNSNAGTPGVTVLFGARDRANPMTRGAAGPQAMHLVLTGADLGNPRVVGDVNGDGLADVSVGAVPRRGSQVGAYLVLGSRTARGTTIDLASPPAGRVVVIPKAAAPVLGGAPVAGLGDVNGDGLDDVGTGTMRVDAGGALRGGAVVVLGRRSWPARVDLARLGRTGITLRTSDRQTATPFPLGDTDADGRADLGLITGDPRRATVDYEADMAWIVRGRAGGSVVRLVDSRRTLKPKVLVGTRPAGWAFRPDVPCGCVFSALGAAGDVNGDGRADMLVPERVQEGTGGDLLDVVFGQRRSAVQVGLGAGLRGIRLSGTAAPRGTTGIGDVTGDGFGDLVAAGPDGTGLVLVEGRRLGVVTPALKPFLLTGTRRVTDVQPAGDVDGDGRTDLLVQFDGSASAAIVYGQATPGVVDLAAPAGAAAPIL